MYLSNKIKKAWTNKRKKEQCNQICKLLMANGHLYLYALPLEFLNNITLFIKGWVMYVLWGVIHYEVNHDQFMIMKLIMINSWLWS
jgi:hypothetical protein